MCKKVDLKLSDMENCIALMSVYRDEWKHRDQMFTSYMWKFVTLSLIITFLPNVLESQKMFPEMAKTFPLWVFPLFGMACSFLGLYLGFAENKRITNIDKAYRRIEELLPQKYKAEKITEWYFKPRTNNLLCLVMHGATLALAILNFSFCIH